MDRRGFLAQLIAGAACGPGLLTKIAAGREGMISIPLKPCTRQKRLHSQPARFLFMDEAENAEEALFEEIPKRFARAACRLQDEAIRKSFQA